MYLFLLTIRVWADFYDKLILYLIVPLAKFRGTVYEITYFLN